MTEEIKAIEQLTIDDTTFIVADLPEEIQQLVKKYEDWRDRLVVAQDEVVLVQSALQTLGQSVVGSIQQFEAAKAEAAEKAAADAAAEAAKAAEPVVIEAAAADVLVIDDDAAE